MLLTAITLCLQSLPKNLKIPLLLPLPLQLQLQLLLQLLLPLLLPPTLQYPQKPKWLHLPHRPHLLLTLLHRLLHILPLLLLLLQLLLLQNKKIHLAQHLALGQRVQLRSILHQIKEAVGMDLYQIVTLKPGEILQPYPV